MKFPYGELVRLTDAAPDQFRAIGILGSICGADKIANQERSQHWNAPVGSWVYLMEVPSGEAIEVPEMYLEMAED
ncbi:hypothetical protein [Celeribacter sp. PS-C1]|uniref:hypothetical protein n=1 Tax=Celeribacter sp. PS-C1 TaxID=2820813 RepID=UPI001CA4E86A|nr:hypothetical protein [Celeribacter sp. PS-C1]MBW6419541.1 hypothetical protein [Celeribacter sp. PS-C1]